jgi:hypothetical protein
MMTSISLRQVAEAQFRTATRANFPCRALVLLASGALLLSCAKSPRPFVEVAPPANTAQRDRADETQAQIKLLPPTIAEVQDAVKRVFKEAAVLDAGKAPAFVAGDFNGDQSPDLAVILTPVPEKLAELNEDYPNWILRDPFASAEARVPRLKVALSDTLLAVIHGYGSNGWRDSQATQTFLLKNAVGSGLRVRATKEALASSPGKKVPLLRGDVIGEVIGNTPGYLYFAGAGYSWYDPQTFKGDEPVPGMIHSAPKEIVRK